MKQTGGKACHRRHALKFWSPPLPPVHVFQTKDVQCLKDRITQALIGPDLAARTKLAGKVASTRDQEGPSLKYLMWISFKMQLSINLEVHVLSECSIQQKQKKQSQHNTKNKKKGMKKRYIFFFLQVYFSLSSIICNNGKGNSSEAKGDTTVIRVSS